MLHVYDFTEFAASLTLRTPFKTNCNGNSTYKLGASQVVGMTRVHFALQC